MFGSLCADKKIRYCSDFSTTSVSNTSQHNSQIASVRKLRLIAYASAMHSLKPSQFLP